MMSSYYLNIKSIFCISISLIILPNTLISQNQPYKYMSSELKIGNYLHIRQTSNIEKEGELISIDNTYLTLKSSNESITIPISKIKSMKLKIQDNAVRRKLVTGSSALLGGAMGYAVTSTLCAIDQSKKKCNKFSFTSSFMGSAIGALTGNIIGVLAFPDSWEDIQLHTRMSTSDVQYSQSMNYILLIYSL